MPKKIGKKSSKNLVQKPGKKFPEMARTYGLILGSPLARHARRYRASVPIDCRV